MTQRRITTSSLPNLYSATIGFDKLMNALDAQLNSSATGNWPPYNVAQIDENQYVVTVAVAGFGMENLEITRDKNILRIDGTPPTGDDEVLYLHKGIAGRAFRREFTLADHIEIADASLELGMLNIHLTRVVPEELQPKRIAITQR
jgi:molecular chaperone IbpA